MHYLDEKGRHTLSPSLYERDAYQDFLRKNPEKISALRIDVKWSPPRDPGPILKLRVEIRGEKTNTEPLVLETRVGAGKQLGNWTSLRMDKDTLEKCGSIIAWRARIYHGDGVAGEMKSFLW